MLSRTNISSVIPELNIKRNKIYLARSATNLGIVFNNKLAWSCHIGVIVGKIYIILRNFWAVIDSTPFAIRMRLTKTYLIPVLLYGCEIFLNCDSHDNRKLNFSYNNITRYVFLKGRRDYISQSAYHIFCVKFDNLLKIRYLILFHKIINTAQAVYLLGRIKFSGMKIIQQWCRTLLHSDGFFTHHKSLEFPIKLHSKVKVELVFTFCSVTKQLILFR